MRKYSTKENHEETIEIVANRIKFETVEEIKKNKVNGRKTYESYRLSRSPY